MRSDDGREQPAVCALYATSIKIDINVTLSSFGAKPLRVARDELIDIEGTLDVASHLGGQVGAGSPTRAAAPARPPRLRVADKAEATAPPAAAVEIRQRSDSGGVAGAC